jgi:hypothetical protein
MDITMIKSLKQLLFLIAANIAAFLRGMILSVGVAAQNGIPFKFPEFTPEQEEKNWQELMQRCAKSGLNLREGQETTLRSAMQKLTQDMDKFYKKHNPIKLIGQLTMLSTLPEQQAEALMEQNGFDRDFHQPMLEYAESVRAALTPQQQVIWERESVTLTPEQHTIWEREIPKFLTPDQRSIWEQVWQKPQSSPKSK